MVMDFGLNILDNKLIYIDSTGDSLDFGQWDGSKWTLKIFVKIMGVLNSEDFDIAQTLGFNEIIPWMNAHMQNRL